jgi:hypothetical protein
LPNPIQKRKEVKSMSDDFFDIGWEEMALLGSLAETLAEGEKERRRLEMEMENEECDCCEGECDQSDPMENDPSNPYETACIEPDDPSDEVS